MYFEFFFKTIARITLFLGLIYAFFYPKVFYHSLKKAIIIGISLLTTILMLIFLIFGYTPIIATQHFELISPVAIVIILSTVFFIIKASKNKD